MSFNVFAASGLLKTILADNVAGDQAQYVKLLDPTAGSGSPIGVAANPMVVMHASALLHVTATGAAAAAVTLTLPASAGNFHYITSLDITLFNSSARNGSSTPVVVTSTNLPGNPAFTFPSAGAIGTVDRYIPARSTPLRSSVVNTNTTIVCPATTGIIWRVNVSYFVAP